MAQRAHARKSGHELLLAVLTAVLLLAAYGMDPTFMHAATQLELASHAWELLLLAVPMTLIIISGGIDLSMGSTMALASIALGLSFERGVSIGGAAVVALVTGALAGAINGVFVAFVRVHPLIVTLATFSAYRGIAEGISMGRPISGFSESFAMLSRGSTWGIPHPALICGVMLLAAGVVLSRTTLGRAVYAMGLNETTCRYSGISVDRIKLLLYTLSGVAAGLAAMLFASRRNTAKADVGTGMELEVITAVVLGGTSIFGGRGGIIGTALGVLLIHEAREFIGWLWKSDEWIPMITGGLLMISVFLGQRFGARPARENALP